MLWPCPEATVRLPAHISERCAVSAVCVHLYMYMYILVCVQICSSVCLSCVYLGHS